MRTYTTRTPENSIQPEEIATAGRKNSEPVYEQGQNTETTPLFFEPGESEANASNEEVLNERLGYPEEFGPVSSVCVMDVFGQTMLESSAGSAFSLGPVIAPGIYFVTMTNANGEIRREKIMKNTGGTLNVTLYPKIDQQAVEREAKRLAREGKVVEAAWYVINKYGLGSPTLTTIGLKGPATTSIVLVTTGEVEVGAPHTIKIPSNVFDFDFSLVINLLAHECLHVQQRSSFPVMADHNEREFLAYYENIFNEVFTTVPVLTDPFVTSQLAEQGLKYYSRMNIEQQMRYDSHAWRLRQFLNNLKTK